jgi:hypothetical protein
MPEEYRIFLEKREARNRPPVPSDPKEALRQCFSDRGITANWTWDQAMNTCKNDDRWNNPALKMADKKHVYQEVVRELQRKEAEQRRQHEEKLASDFIQMLFDKGIDEFTTFRYGLCSFGFCFSS